MCIKSVFESIHVILSDITKAIPYVYDTITEKNSSAVRILHHFTSNLLQLPLVKYSPLANVLLCRIFPFLSYIFNHYFVQCL